MAKLLDTINWISDGERATANVLDRPLKELVTKMDNNEFEVISKYSGVSIITDDLDGAVQDNDFVYQDEDNTLHQGLGGDPISEKVIGLYQIIEGNLTIVFSGTVTYTGLTAGKTYYLSDTILGQITDIEYPGAIKVGVAMPGDKLLIDIGSASGDSSSGLMVELDDTITTLPNEFDFVYRISDTEFGAALVDGTEKENVIGVYRIINGRNFIVYNGELAYDAFTLINELLVIGESYYLSPTEAGKIQKDTYPGAIKIGTALSVDRLLIDIDKAPSDAGNEEFEYQFLLSDSSYTKCYFNVFSELNTMTHNDGGTSTNVVYSALNTSYTIQDTFSIETPTSIIEENVKTFLITENTVGTFTRWYSIDGGIVWTEVPENGKIWYESGYTDFKLRYTSTQADFELKSFGVLLNDQGYVGNTRVRLREYTQLQTDLVAGTAITLPYDQKYTNDNQSLAVRIEGMTLIPIIDYIEIDDSSLSFNVDLQAGDVIQFEEFYGYVDVSLENTDRVNTLITRVDVLQRLDKEFEILDMTDVIYDIDDNIELITYSTGNTEDWVRDGVLTHIDYYDTDGVTKLATNAFTYDGNGRLLTTTWTNL